MEEFTTHHSARIGSFLARMVLYYLATCGILSISFYIYLSLFAVADLQTQHQLLNGVMVDYSLIVTMFRFITILSVGGIPILYLFLEPVENAFTISRENLPSLKRSPLRRDKYLLLSI